MTAKKAKRATSGTEALAFDAGDGRTVSALLDDPRDARAIIVLGHGAGAGMRHPFLAGMAEALAERGIGTFRYQFPYMEAGKSRVDAPAVAHAAVRAAVAEAHRRAPALPLFAGGKSFGGRMTSETAAEAPLAAVRGLVFLGFPLHPPGKPAAAVQRGEHLSDVTVPMLFLQGTRDEFAHLDLLRPRVKRLGKLATLHLVEGGNHSFKVPTGTGRKDAEVRSELADALAAWVDKVARR
jgi:predicted alpha/beta-hydrolase family hydrolase